MEIRPAAAEITAFTSFIFGKRTVSLVETLSIKEGPIRDLFSGGELFGLCVTSLQIDGTQERSIGNNMQKCLMHDALITL